MLLRWSAWLVLHSSKTLSVGNLRTSSKFSCTRSSRLDCETRFQILRSAEGRGELRNEQSLRGFWLLSAPRICALRANREGIPHRSRQPLTRRRSSTSLDHRASSTAAKAGKTSSGRDDRVDPLLRVQRPTAFVTGTSHAATTRGGSNYPHAAADRTFSPSTMAPGTLAPSNVAPITTEFYFFSSS